MAFSTRTILPGSENVQRPGLARSGEVSLDEDVRISLILRRKSDAVGFATEAQTGEPNDSGATLSDVELVEQFAHEFGLSVVEASAAKRRVIVTGTAEEVQKALGVSFVCYEQQSSGQRFRGREGTISMPSELQGIVTAVLGLDTRPIAKPHFRKQLSPATATVTPQQTTAGTFTPQQVAALYSFPASATGKGQTIAIIELGGGYKTADLKAYFTSVNLPVPSVTAVSVDGGKNTPGSDADSEVLLDIEIAGAVANGAKIAVYFAPNTDKGFVDAITQAVHDTTRKPSVISISWGGPEDSWSQQSRNAMNAALQDAATLGVTVTAASGDSGSTDGVTDGKLHVDFPASSPFALACGGTTLRGTGTTVSSETVWNETARNSGATGGGISNAFPIPAYQKTAGVPKQPQTNFVGRGVPDIAGNADPVTGYQIRVNGQNVVVGGTSAVAPLWAGLVALLNQQLGTPVGFLNPKLYSLTATALRDITTGDNDDGKKGFYKAQKGWDACTGLGTPNGAALLKAFSSIKTKQVTVLPGSAPKHIEGAEWVPLDDPQQQVAATILLRHSDEQLADDLLAGAAPALPHGEFSSLVAASPEALHQISTFAQGHGLRVTESNPTTRTVEVQGTAEQMREAFGVTLELVSEAQGPKYVSHQDAIQIPESLSNLVASVLGLDQRPVARHHHAMTKTV